MFRMLGVFPGAEIEPFAAAALAGVRVSEARAVLEDLVDANLLEEPSPKRYRFHDLIRQRSADASAEVPAGQREAALAATIDRIIGGCTERGRDGLTVQFALTIVAFLGRRGEMEQWRRICTAAVHAA